MSPYEIFLSTKDYCEGDIKDTIVEMNNLISDIQDNPNKLAYQLSNELEAYCLANDICPLCGDDLISINTYEETREYQGKMVGETMIRIGCADENCTYTN